MPVLDGLRGIAILLVLGLHFFRRDLFTAVSPTIGWVAARLVDPARYGVELFFVLSGFLITGILLDTSGSKNFFLNFYVRRTLRIFPLYYLSLIVVLCVVPVFVHLDTGATTVIQRQAWLWTYMADWPIRWVWDDSELFKLGHFWSLAVEEHFYLIWPALVALLPKRRLFAVCCVLIVIASTCRFFASICGSETSTTFARLLIWPSVARIDGLCVGAMIAIVVRTGRASVKIANVRTIRLLVAGFGIAAAALLMLPRRYLQSPLPMTVTEVAIVGLCGALLIRSLQTHTGEWLHHLLTSRVLIAFGTYSYGIYVFHGILRPLFQHWITFNGWPQAHGLSIAYAVVYYLLATAASFLIAYISYHGIERHFLGLKRYFRSRTA